MFHSGPARRVRAYRPRLEVLESRTLLSTYLVDHLADDGVGSGLNGSLRYCITNAVDGDAINFGVTGLGRRYRRQPAGGIRWPGTDPAPPRPGRRLFQEPREYRAFEARH